MRALTHVQHPGKAFQAVAAGGLLKEKEGLLGPEREVDYNL